MFLNPPLSDNEIMKYFPIPCDWDISVDMTPSVLLAPKTLSGDSILSWTDLRHYVMSSDLIRV